MTKVWGRIGGDITIGDLMITHRLFQQMIFHFKSKSIFYIDENSLLKWDIFEKINKVIYQSEYALSRVLIDKESQFLYLMFTTHPFYLIIDTENFKIQKKISMDLGDKRIGFFNNLKICFLEPNLNPKRYFLEDKLKNGLLKTDKFGFNLNSLVCKINRKFLLYDFVIFFEFPGNRSMIRSLLKQVSFTIPGKVKLHRGKWYYIYQIDIEDRGIVMVMSAGSYNIYRFDCRSQKMQLPLINKETFHDFENTLTKDQHTISQKNNSENFNTFNGFKIIKRSKVLVFSEKRIAILKLQTRAKVLKVVKLDYNVQRVCIDHENEIIYVRKINLEKEQLAESISSYSLKD